MYGSVEIIDNENNVYHGDISGIIGAFMDELYTKGIQSDRNRTAEFPVLMYDSINIVIEEDIENIIKIEIKELREVNIKGSEEGYCIDSFDLYLIKKIIRPDGIVVLKCGRREQV